MDFSTVVTAIILPTIFGVAVSLPFWIKRRTMLGNLVGSVAIAGVMIVLIWQGYGDFVGEQQACSDAGTCGLLSIDAIFTKFLGFVAMGWLDVLFVLIIGGMVETQVKKRSKTREWW